MPNLKYFVPVFIGLALAIGFIVASTKKSEAAIPPNVPPPPSGYSTKTLLSATTTSATSTNLTGGGGYMVINNAKKVTMYFTHGGVATTSTAGGRFRVQTSRDGETWHDFNKLIGADVSSTATSTYTIQGATSTVPVALDLSDDTFYAIRCISQELAAPLGTDGEQSCVATAEF